MKSRNFPSQILRWCTALVFVLSFQSWGCAVSCPELGTDYHLTGCQGEDKCKLTQTGCQVRFQCEKTVQECNGVMTNDVINMGCIDSSSQSLQAVALVKEGQRLALTFVKNKQSCQGELKL